MLIPAHALANGVTILQDDTIDEVTYVHLELESHDVIYAEGAPFESYVDDENREMFDNAAEYASLHSWGIRQPARFCAPRVEEGEELETVRRRLAARARSDLAAPMLRRISSQSCRPVLMPQPSARERPSASRTQRFLDLLKTAPSSEPLSQEGFVRAQNSILEPRFHEFAYRSIQNWLGGHSRYRETVDFVPPRPEDVAGLMQGLCAMSARGRAAAAANAAVDPVVHAAIIAFGFLFIHPFIDGNGRLHRYLLHEELSTLGFTPRGTVLPVSAFILSNLDLYSAVLEQFSKPLMARTDFTPSSPVVCATGNDARFFRFFDATAQALFLYRALERTVEYDFEEEIHYLIGVERARARLKDEIDWPAQSLDLFINVVHQNNGTLSNTKRDSHFSWLTDDERDRFVREVHEAFNSTSENASL